MSQIEQYPVLEYTVNLLSKAIVDSKTEKKSESVSVIKDGNSIIQLEHVAEGDNVTLMISDKNEILLSEDLLEELQDISAPASASAELKAALQSLVIVVNELTIETKFIFQAVKESFDTLSTSYEFIKTTAKHANGFSANFKFGDHKFEVVVVNGAGEVTVEANCDGVKDQKVAETIKGDVAKVASALNKLFK
ncbi:hypothetical protein LPB86_14490 [Pedobacter sp. MC2016-14]|uniref:hypothetical protein n=1 Tax=Pedobacter sp. MC2016-14 TaxID=2897327 RepID=UPI001E3F4D32|nr:hypothetical protein [Pedobacter sp. MC2016-14]MCD0489448.1 hypothetical protein [Pedobacter sp. MC2016-14]